MHGLPITLSIVFVMFLIGQVPAHGQAAVAPAVTPVTSSALRDRLQQTDGRPTAVLAWNAWDGSCANCAQWLQVVATPPAELRVWALGVDQLRTEKLNPKAAADTATAYQTAGVSENRLLAYPSPGGSAGARGMTEYVEDLGLNPQLFSTPSFLLFDAKGAPLDLRLPPYFALNLADAGGQSDVTIDPPSLTRAAGFVALNAPDVVTRLVASLAKRFHEVSLVATQLRPRDALVLTSVDPQPFAASGALRMSSVLAMPVRVTGLRQGRLVSIEGITLQGAN